MRERGPEIAVDSGITVVILRDMKTAISIPDPIFEAAEAAAKNLGVSRSEFITNALREYLAAHRYDGVTEKLNELCDEESDGLDPVMEKMQWMSLPKEEW